MSPEKWSLEDYFSFQNAPLLGDILVFWGVTLFVFQRCCSEACKACVLFRPWFGHYHLGSRQHDVSQTSRMYFCGRIGRCCLQAAYLCSSRVIHDIMGLRDVRCTVGPSKRQSLGGAVASGHRCGRQLQSPRCFQYTLGTGYHGCSRENEDRKCSAELRNKMCLLHASKVTLPCSSLIVIPFHHMCCNSLLLRLATPRDVGPQHHVPKIKVKSMNHWRANRLLADFHYYWNSFEATAGVTATEAGTTGKMHIIVRLCCTPRFWPRGTHSFTGLYYENPCFPHV